MQQNKISLLKNNKGLFLLVIGIIIGIILLVSDFTPQDKTAEKEGEIQTAKSYVEELEIRLEELINKINGVSDAKVLITLKSGSEYVYASDSTEKNEKHVIVEDGLVCVKEYMPSIEGVAVVCKGGNSPTVKAKITEMLRSVLGIYSTRVYITE